MRRLSGCSGVFWRDSNPSHGSSSDRSAIAANLETPSGTVSYVSLAQLANKTGADVGRLPHPVKIRLENIARRGGGRDGSQADGEALTRWQQDGEGVIVLTPARVL